MIDRVEDVVPRDLRKVHSRAGDRLVLLFSLFVQEPVCRLVEGDIWSVARRKRDVAVCHAVALENVLRVVLLVNGDRPVFSVPVDLHAEHLRHVPEVRHLETIHQLLLQLTEELLVVAKQNNVIYIECQDGSAGLVFEHVDARIRLERAEADFREMIVHGAEPVLGALSKTVETLMEFHHERNSRLVVCLVAGSVEERCLHVQHEHLVVELGRDGQHHADALQSTDGCEGAAAVDPGYLRPSQHHQTTFEEVVRLDLVDPAGANHLLSSKDGGRRYQLVDTVLLEAVDLLVCRRLPSCRLGETYSLLERARNLQFVSPSEWFPAEAVET